MRQAGFLAAACSYALDHNVDRLKDDHARAKRLETTLNGLPYVSSVLAVQTNIVLFTLKDRTADNFLAELREREVLAIAFAPDMVRMVLHLDVDDAGLDHTINALQQLT